MKQLQSGRVTLNDAEVVYCKALYDGDLRTADHHVGRFLDSLEGLSLRERTLVVITSDHGEELNDHYPSRTGDHGHSLRDPQLLVPLVVHDPIHRFAVREVAAQVRLLDVMPTIAELLGVPIGRPLDGRSLVPLMTGEEKHDRIALSGQTRSGPQRTSLRCMGYKYIVTLRPETGKHPPLVPAPPPVQLYDLEADPREQLNLVSEKPELVLALDQLLQERFGAVLRDTGLELPDEVDPGLVERLRSLGYVDP